MSCNLDKKCYYTPEVKFKKMLDNKPENFDWCLLYEDKVIPESLIIYYIEQKYLDLDKLSSINNYSDTIFKYLINTSIEYFNKNACKFPLYIIMRYFDELSVKQREILKEYVKQYDIRYLEFNHLVILLNYNYITHSDFYSVTCSNILHYIDNKDVFIQYMRIAVNDNYFFDNMKKVLAKSNHKSTHIGMLHICYIINFINGDLRFDVMRVIDMFPDYNLLNKVFNSDDELLDVSYRTSNFSNAFILPDHIIDIQFKKLRFRYLNIINPKFYSYKNQIKESIIKTRNKYNKILRDIGYE